MDLNSYVDEVRDFMEKINGLNRGSEEKIIWLEEEFSLLKISVTANEADKIRHQIYDMMFLLFEICVDHDFDLVSEWELGREKKQKKNLSGRT